MWYKSRSMQLSIKVKKRNNPEGRIVLDIIHYLRAKGYAVGKMKSMGVFREGHYCKDKYLFLGLPDVLCFTRDKIVFIEAKAGTKQSDWQKCFQECCERCGVSYILARSVEDVFNV